MAINDNLLLQEEDELSIKDIINKFKDAFNFIKLHFWKLFIFGIIGSVIGFLIAYNSKPIYSAKVKFIMKESNGGSGLMSSLGTLGSLIGGTAGSGSPMNRTLAIMGSERIVGAALLKSIIVNQKSDLSINHLIEILELRKTWAEDSTLNGVKFSAKDVDVISLNLKQRKAYKILINLLIGEKSKFIGSNFNKKDGVFDLTINTINEDFSIEFNKLLYKELEQFMYNQSITSSGKNVSILSDKIDSIKSELNSVQNALARKTDRTLGLLMQEDKVDQKKLMMKEQMLTIMYGEAQKNLETFKFVNESINAGLEILEYPISPIQPIRKGKIKYSLLGFFLFSSICFGFLYFKSYFIEINK